MPNAAFTAIVTSVDKSSQTLQTIQKQIKDLSGEMTRLHVATQRLELAPTMFRRIGDAAAFANRHIQAMHSRMGGIFSRVSSIFTPLAGLTAGGSAAGLVGIVKHVAEAREEMLHTSEMLGTTPRTLGQLDYAAKMTGTSVETMHKSFSILNRVMGDAGRGKNKSALELFTRLGITGKELREGDAAAILPKIAAGFERVHSATLRASMAQALFGKGGREMIPWLHEGPEVLTKWNAEFEKFAYQFKPKDDENLKSFRRSWIGLETAVGGFTNMLGAQLAPVLQPVVSQMALWVAANRDWLTTKITEYVGDLVKWLQGDEFRRTAEQFRRLASAAGDVVGWLGPANVAFGVMAGYAFGPLINGIGSVAFAVMGLSGAVKGVMGAIVAFEVPAWFAFLMRMGTLSLPLFLSGDTPTKPGDEEKRAPDRERYREWFRKNYGHESRGLLDLWDQIWRRPGEAPPPPRPAPGTGTAPIGPVPFWPGYMPPSRLPGLIPGPFDRPGGIPPLQILPQLYTPGAAPAGPPGQQGGVDILVRFENAPPGTTVETRPSGQVRVPPPEVGHSFPAERMVG